MKWLAYRLAEPSTRIGLMILMAVLTAVTSHVPASPGEWASLMWTAAAGVLGVVTKAPGSPDAVPVVVAARSG